MRYAPSHMSDNDSAERRDALLVQVVKYPPLSRAELKRERGEEGRAALATALPRLDTPQNRARKRPDFGRSERAWAFKALACDVFETFVGDRRRRRDFLSHSPSSP
jgi:hypothetical protein